MSVSKLWNDEVKAMEWRGQRWSLTEAMNYELGSMNYELINFRKLKSKGYNGKGYG